MALAINLLPRKGARELLQERFLSRVRKGSFVVLAIYGVTLVLVFGGRIIAGQIKKNLVGQVEVAEGTVESYATTESQQLMVKSKLQTVAQVIKSRGKWSKLMAEIRELIPDENAVTEVSLEEIGEMKVSFKTPRLQELALVLNALWQLGAKREGISGVVLDRVEKEPNGNYGFTLVFNSKPVTSNK